MKQTEALWLKLNLERKMKVAKNEKLDKLDLNETKGANGGCLYAFDVGQGVQGYYVPGYQRPFFDRRQARESCWNTSAEEIRCKNAAEAQRLAWQEWQHILLMRQYSLANMNLVDDSSYDGFITGSGTSDLY